MARVRGIRGAPGARPFTLSRGTLAAALGAVVVVVALILVIAWRFGPAGTAAPYGVEFTTEEGNGAGEGTVDSPLRVVARVPERSAQSGDPIAAVSLQLLDEAGNPARFGLGSPGPAAMRSGANPGEWEFVGSVPSASGTYHVRLILQTTTSGAAPQSIEPAGPLLRAKPEQGSPPRSGFVFPNEGDLWILSTDGKRERRITFLASGGGGAAEPEWSPDGSAVAFVRQSVTGTGQLPATAIWTMGADGGGAAARVTSGPREVLARPAWSNDGHNIYYAVDTLPDAQDALGNSKADARNRRIDRVDVRTGVRSTYTLGAQAPAMGGPGEDVLFLEDTPPKETGGSPGQQLVRAGVEGRQVLVGPGEFQRIHTARMSPDGRWVVISATSGGPRAGGPDLLGWLLLRPEVAYAHDVPWDLFLVSATGGKATRLTSLNEDLPYPVWLDNSTIAFMGATGLYRLAISGAGTATGEPARLREGVRHGTLTWHGP
ncbi:MAG: hypothetical protein ACJ78Q_01035 [Chloroflexia bacterium]